MKISSTIILTTLAVSFTGCTEDLQNCPSKMCIVAGGWKLTEAYVDNVKEDGDLSLYRLILYTPVPETSETSDFDRIQPSGNWDNGAWSIANNGTVLTLTPGNNVQFTENWIIESMTPRRLVLVMSRNTGIKQGPSVIRFILEPL